MTLGELLAQFRSDSQDNVGAFLSSDAEVTGWLNEAQEEAALRKSLLFEASNAGMCQIAVTAALMSYPLNQNWFRISRATFTEAGATTPPCELYLTDRLAQDEEHPGWRTCTDIPRQLIIDDVSVQLGCLPSTDGTLALEGYRAPLTALSADLFDNANPPVLVTAGNPTLEIGRAHHRFLVHWALFRHYSKPDAEIHDAGRADKEEKAFIAYFGERPDADMRRDYEANRPAHNRAQW